MNKLNRIKCLKCLTVIESKHRHDFRWCPCATVAIDGGTDYQRIVGDLSNFVIVNDDNSETITQ